MNLLSTNHYELSNKFTDIQKSKQFPKALIGFMIVSILVHILGNRILKMVDISVILFFAMIWIVKWEGRPNREAFYFVLAWLGISSFLFYMAM